MAQAEDKPGTAEGREEAGRGPLNIIVIPHSHWDREWYATFEEFRFFLVQFVDELLDTLEEDEGFRSFLMDGQVSLLEDYLEVRPEKREQLKRFVGEGRLDIGPWYVQPDEFLVSGEALVRNLLLGHRVGREFGPVMKQGYVPDTFGHVSRLPQILAGFDVKTFFTMRGLGEDLERFKTEFWWESPDGSRVLAHFLSETYSNAAVLGPDPAKVSFRHDRLADPSGFFVKYDNLYELRDRLASRAAGDTVLFMNGSDHVTVQPRFSHYVFELNRAMPDHLFNGRLGDFERLVLEGNPELNTHRGELLSARYQPILKGVYSSRTYLKQHNERAQQLLEGKAERASVVVRALGGRDYSPHLRYAWRELLKNHAHDSIGGCSADAVHRQMMGRFDTATRVGDKVLEESLDFLATAVSPGTAPDSAPVVVFNPSPWVRGGTVRAEVSLDADVPLRRRIFDWIGEKPLDLDDSVLLDQDGGEVPFAVRGRTLQIEDALYRRKSVRRATIEFAAEGVPPLGYKSYRLVNRPEEAGDGPEEGAESAEPPWEVALENERLKVTVEADVTLSVLDKETGAVYGGLNLLVSEGDAGDEYNFSPPREQRRLTSAESDWTVEAGEDRHSLVLRGTLRLPRGLAADRGSRSPDTLRCPVVVEVGLAPGSRRVEVRTEFVNRARDHRLRAVFPSGIAASESVAETAFGVVKRPTATPETTGPREVETAVYAARRFVCVEDGQKGLAVFNKGLPEYEATPEGEVSLTLLRCVGWLSRGDLTTRSGQAGPSLATPEAQCQGRHVFEYAVMPYAVPEGGDGWLHADLFREAEEYHLPLEARAARRGEEPEGPGAPPGGVPGSFMALRGRRAVLSAIKQAADREGFIVRVFNASEEPTTATLDFGFPIAAAYAANLNEEILESVAHAGHVLEVPLAGCAMQTVLVKLHRPERWAERLRRATARVAEPGEGA